ERATSASSPPVKTASRWPDATTQRTITPPPTERAPSSSPPRAGVDGQIPGAQPDRYSGKSRGVFASPLPLTPDDESPLLGASSEARNLPKPSMRDASCQALIVAAAELPAEQKEKDKEITFDFRGIQPTV
ncbi:hypothetical protein T484DRAFT_1778824, partial [Baffinella frigidus]